MNSIRTARSIHAFTLLTFSLLIYVCATTGASGYNASAKDELRRRAHEMFMHGYRGYMDYAFPHDELMPISCKGRQRGVTPSRGDVDDSLGNFSLTLVDTLDTLVVVGEFDEFEHAVHLIVQNVRFDSDLVVSVFETNIRMVGGLVSGHLMALLVKAQNGTRFHWYDDQLLRMAVEVADRLLPAFNTTGGIPHSRINLKHGMTPELKSMADTCTACAGTMILEWAALSRLSGNPVYEQRARQAMDFLWNQRNRASDLMGTVLNVHSGDWVRRDSGIGAGIDSYYEYTLKAYILLGEEDYLFRFNKHYEAVMRYLAKGPLFVDVHMHRPAVASRSFMDSLLAFWPGVQVLKGDLRPAIEMHEMLYTAMRRNNGFLPDAFTHDLQAYWAQHPLRPEFIESTYFLYRATRDPHYLDVAKEVMESLEKVRTRCGFASIKDVRSMEKEDQMESFFLSETTKYLYMIFAEPSQLPFDPDNYVLTTEAHFLPLTIGERYGDDEDASDRLPRRVMLDPDEIIGEESSPRFQSACPHQPSPAAKTSYELTDYGSGVRASVSKVLSNMNTINHALNAIGAGPSQGSCSSASDRLKTWAFNSNNKQHLDILKRMGLELEIHPDGRIRLTRNDDPGSSPQVLTLDGFQFDIQADITGQHLEGDIVPKVERVIQVVSEPHLGGFHLEASHAQFGLNLANDINVEAEIHIASPQQACTELKNSLRATGAIVVAQRGNCMFQEKARNAEAAGAVGLIIIDNHVDSSAAQSPYFAMSADNSIPDDITIPVVFLFHAEAEQLLEQFQLYPSMVVRLAERAANPQWLFEEYLVNSANGLHQRRRLALANPHIALNEQRTKLRINFRLGTTTATSTPDEQRQAVEANVEAIGHSIHLPNGSLKLAFLQHCRQLAYSLLLGHAEDTPGREDYEELREFLSLITPLMHVSEVDAITMVDTLHSTEQQLHGPSRSVVCNLSGQRGENYGCVEAWAKRPAQM